VFHKYEAFLDRQAALAREAEDRPGLTARGACLWRALRVPPESVREFWWLYLGLWVVLSVWGGSYMLKSLHDLGWSPGLLHHVNLPFHEAGHVVFGIFGSFIRSLGGTLGQLLMPIICAAALLRTRGDTFGASVCLWWFGQNFLDIAPYMADARAGRLPLLGGNFGRSSPYGFHDWEYILGETGLLAHDTTLAAITLYSGRLIMLLALVWAAWLLWRARFPED
jgi:hypothetical protein